MSNNTANNDVNALTAPKPNDALPHLVVNGYTIPQNAGHSNRFHIYDLKGKIYCSSARTLDQAKKLANGFPPIKNTKPSIGGGAAYELINGYTVPTEPGGYGRYYIYDDKGNVVSSTARSYKLAVNQAKKLPSIAIVVEEATEEEEPGN